MVDNVDVVRDAPKAPLAPIDTSVQLPESVRRAAALAESFYQKQAAPVEPAPAPQPEPVQAQPAPQPAPQPEPAPQQAQPAPVQPSVQPEPVQPQEPQQPPTDTIGPAEQEHHRYLSMKGRYEQAQQTIGVMQEQMQQLGDELIRTQRMIQGAQQPNEPPRPQLTDEDIQTYGPDLVNMVQRAAVQAVSPELEAVKGENAQLKHAISQQQKQTVHQILDHEVPNWRAINRDQRFLRWLSLPDIYSGQLRRNLLNNAFNAAAAPRVVSFFKGFLQEEAATGHIEVPQAGQPQVPAPVPRQAAIQLSTLAAPGRPSPAGGQPPSSADKPIYTRAQITEFYRHVREQRYAGREQEKAAIERDIFAAQREGRVRS